jgi:hypothetical protein
MFERLNTTAEIKDAWGQWISGLADWDLFVTLTFRDPVYRPGSNWTRPGWRQAKQAWAQFTDLIMSDCAAGRWVRCFELQKWRGAPHIHALVSGVDPDLNIKDARDWAYHQYGLARITQYDPNLGAAWYISKYVESHTFDIEFGGNFPGGKGGEMTNRAQ